MHGTSTATVQAEVLKSVKPAWRFYILFFISGFPALIYQIVWQRSLFTLYGVNIQSVTAIVTVFMLGLGLGSLAGGRLSTIGGVNVLRAFGMIELSIGAFGFFSLSFFHFVGQFTAGASTALTVMISFLLLLVPTLLMGSTLPLLVTYMVRRTDNVGASVGSLYAVNTLGSGTACFLASIFVMRVLGETGSVRMAAGLNFLVGATAVLLALQQSGDTIQVQANARPTQSTIPVWIGMLFAGAAGFVALAYEILWYHIYSLLSGGVASCFALLLGFYLIGIAYGSHAVHRICQEKLNNDLPRTLRSGSTVVALGAIVSFLVAPATAFVLSIGKIPYQLVFVFVAIAAAMLGAAFPIISHASIDPNEKAGRRLSYIYVSNIIGSALGSLSIGFIAMDYLSTAQISWLLLAFGLALAIALALFAKPLSSRPLLIGSVSAILVLALCSHLLFSSMFERLMIKGDYRPGVKYRNLVENRSGVIAVDSNEIVYGGGVYDGQFNIDPLNASNGIFRAYAIAALHPNPRRVLVIGLSSGSWTQVLVNHPSVEDTTVVEINPGYLPLIQQRPIVASLLHNPKVHIEIDDGRRWLLSHPDSRFDFILMNSTFNWRANATNLLSVEFLNLVRQHLNPGGILYYNTTSSGRVQLTGVTVFPYAFRVSNFLAVSDSPIVFDRERWRRILEGYRIDGRPVFDLSSPADRACIEDMISLPQKDNEDLKLHLYTSVEARSSLVARLHGLPLITDDNMGTEWW
jgi:spermidine synthase